MLEGVTAHGIETLTPPHYRLGDMALFVYLVDLLRLQKGQIAGWLTEIVKTLTITHALRLSGRLFALRVWFRP